MIDRINNICRIEYTRATDVAEFQYLPGELIYIDAPWSELTFTKNPNFQIEEIISKAGRSYESDFSVNLPAPFQNTGLLVLRLSFSDGKSPMIIGSPDLPVRLEETHRLSSKSLSFNHRSWHYPYRVPVDFAPVTPPPIPVAAAIAWELAEWDTGTDFIDSNVRIFANEVLKLEQYGNGSGTINVFEGDTIRVQYFYLDIAEGSPVNPFLQLLIDSAVIDSQPVAIPGTGTFNHSFIIDFNKEILVRAIDLG